MKNTKAEITTKQIVGLIVLILSFSIILFFIFRLDLGETADKEICHNSVLLNAKSKLGSSALDCRTNYVCISGGGDCTDLTPKLIVRVDPTDKNQIMKALAEEMSNCWWMFGEGEVKYGEGFAERSIQCSICSIISFDESLKGETITYSGFYNYLKENMKGTETYFRYLYGDKEVEEILNSSYWDRKIIEINLNDPINLAEKQSILVGVDMNLFQKDRYLHAVIVQTSETSLTECDKFITKA